MRKIRGFSAHLLVSVVTESHGREKTSEGVDFSVITAAATGSRVANVPTIASPVAGHTRTRLQRSTKQA